MQAGKHTIIIACINQVKVCNNMKYMFGSHNPSGNLSMEILTGSTECSCHKVSHSVRRVEFLAMGFSIKIVINLLRRFPLTFKSIFLCFIRKLRKFVQ